MTTKSKRKSLQDPVPSPKKTLPKPDLGLDGLEAATAKIDKPAALKKARPKRKGDGKPKRLSVDLDSELFANFKAWCAVNQTTIKEKVVQLIRKTVERG